MALRLKGQTTGYVELAAPASAADNTLTLPNGNGTNGQVLATNGSGGLSFTTISALPLTGGTLTGGLTVNGTNTTAKIHLHSTNSGISIFDPEKASISLTATGMNSTSKYTPSINFGSTDPQFTTTNPKFGAVINAQAVQAYSTDTTGGMSLNFWTSPSNPGTGHGLVQRMTITYAGRVGIGTNAPSSELEVNGTIRDSIGPLRRLGVNAQSGAYTFVVGDAGKIIRSAGSGAAITLNQNIFTAGDMISVFNVSGGNNTIVQGSGVTLHNTADAATGTRTVAAKGMVTIVCTASNEFAISGSQLT